MIETKRLLDRVEVLETGASSPPGSSLLPTIPGRWGRARVSSRCGAPARTVIDFWRRLKMPGRDGGRGRNPTGPLSSLRAGAGHAGNDATAGCGVFSATRPVT